jgi:transposase
LNQGYLNTYKNNNVSYVKVASIFQIGEKTLRRWIKRFDEEQSLERKNKKAISYKITQNQVKYLLKLVNKYPTFSIRLLWSKMHEKFDNFIISESQVRRVIRDNNITRKRTRVRHYPDTRYNKPINLNNLMKTFYEEVDKYALNKIISIDETSIHAEMTNNYSRCELGKRCVKKTKDNRVFRKFTLVCAINNKKIIGWTLYENSGMNGERMVQFIDDFIVGKYKKHLIIMDNGGAHKNIKVKDKIIESKNKLLFSVPYRPKTNAIESWFNQFKYYFQLPNSAITYRQLKQHVNKSIRSIPKSSYYNYIKYAYEEKSSRKYSKKKSTRRRDKKKYKI